MPVEPFFPDRHAAGLALAGKLAAWANRRDVVVLGMARGGVAVAAPIARALAAPLDTFVCRKLGVPGIEEVAFGAIAEGGHRPVVDAVHSFIGLPKAVVSAIVKREQFEIARRIRCYRENKRIIHLAGLTVIVVDDGLASGATLRAAGIALRRFGPAHLIAAVPVASTHGMREVATEFDEVIACITPDPFGTVSQWYHHYAPVSDASVRTLLGRSAAGACATDAPLVPADVEREVVIPTGESGPVSTIAGDLGRMGTAAAPRGLVVLAHGGGSSRGSYRNRYLAARVRYAGWATLRVDLLGERERDADSHGEIRFDIKLITSRLFAATAWCIEQRLPGSDHIVLFGASTGAAAAVGVAARLGARVAGVVSRSGRVDLARESLAHVFAPTLLVVGSADRDTVQSNRDCLPHLGGSVTLRVVPGAGHTFEEAGTLGRAGELVSAFLTRLHNRNRLTRCWPTLTADGRLAQASAYFRGKPPSTRRPD